MHPKTLNILLVEDSQEDIDLMKEALKDSAVLNAVHVVKNGQDAMDYLGDPSKSRPNIVLLDLNMPKKNGRQVLKEIKSDPRLKLIPVIILTTSRSQNDILECYQSHCNCFICKPIDLEGFFKVVRKIEEFWFNLAELPPQPS